MTTLSGNLNVFLLKPMYLHSTIQVHGFFFGIESLKINNDINNEALFFFIFVILVDPSSRFTKASL